MSSASYEDDNHKRVTRRVALQLGAGAGAAALTMPYLRFGDAPSDLFALNDAQLALNPIPSWPVPRIITRAQWGANEGLRKSGQLYDSSIAKLVVHHTGTPNSATNYAALARGILSSETAGEYIDIAYHWLIDPLGNIYEGRWARDYPAGSSHTGESNGANVRGAHASYHNTRTIGIALMGNYDLIAPPKAMTDALVRLLAWKCARWGIDPRGRSVYNASNGTARNLFHICSHRDVNPTACPGMYVQPMLPTIRDRVASAVLGGGYWIASSRGRVLAFGGFPALGSANILPSQTVVEIVRHPTGHGYWLVTQDGAVFAFGASRYLGGMNGKRLNAPIVGMTATPSGRGYWLLGRDGGVFSFGDARFYGSTGAMVLNKPVIGMVRTNSGRGYWLFASDGGIFCFGDARFFGSTGGIRLNQPIVAMAKRPDGDGYWLVASDGGVFCFGKAPFAGSGVGRGSPWPCVGILNTTSGKGYVLLRADGSLTPCGDAPTLGSATGWLGAAAVGIVGKLNPR